MHGLASKPEQVTSWCLPLHSSSWHPDYLHGFTPLGYPVGPTDFCKEVFLDWLRKLKVALDALQCISDLLSSTHAWHSPKQGAWPGTLTPPSINQCCLKVSCKMEWVGRGNESKVGALSCYCYRLIQSVAPKFISVIQALTPHCLSMFCVLPSNRALCTLWVTCQKLTV